MKTKKNIVKLTENELKNIITESVKRNINEINFQKGKNFIIIHKLTFQMAVS